MNGRTSSNRWAMMRREKCGRAEIFRAGRRNADAGWLEKPIAPSGSYFERNRSEGATKIKAILTNSEELNEIGDDDSVTSR